MTRLECFFKNEARLWHRAINGIDQEENSIHDEHHALNFTTEVGVARGINNIDLDTCIMDGSVLGDNGNSTLTLLIHTVHDALSDFLVIPEGASLLEHAVQQGRFPVVNVGNDGDIAEHFIPLNAIAAECATPRRAPSRHRKTCVESTQVPSYPITGFKNARNQRKIQVFQPP